MNLKRGLGIGFLFVGIFIILTGRVLTGAVIGAKPENYLGLFGLAVFIVGILMLLARKGKKKLEELVPEEVPIGGSDYYVKRANELTKYGGDAWISQWEADGILNELDRKGYTIAYGKNIPEMHLAGKGPKFIPHFNVSVPTATANSERKSYKKKHFLVTRDPRDPRLKTVGFREYKTKTKRIRSKVYHPMHPRKSGREKKKYTGKISVS